MPDYKVLARRYRPQTFAEVLGQDAIVATLKNAIQHNRLAHAYLFCGSRGTGKTTLARVFAKALNCQNPTSNYEPCNACPSCKEITMGNSLDVLEIDGASHRGIDDVRQINENVGYATSSGKYRIYIIDEVHMLTKEAFNALLKTLEEPPPKVKFFFATTEPHKVLPTILSRCQRFNLNRIPPERIVQKLGMISQELGISVHEEALQLIANRADGGLRDAESLMDQILSFHEGEISAEVVASVLGSMPKDIMFALDQAGKQGNLALAFDVAYQVFSQGKDLIHFVENLTEHFRNILMVKLAGKANTLLTLSSSDREKYEESAKLYTQEQCMTILDFLIEAQNQIRFMPSGRIALEALLLRIMRIHQRVPADVLVRRLSELEQAIGKMPSTQQPVVSQTPSPEPKPSIAQAPIPEQKPEPKPKTPPPLPTPPSVNLTEDPTPSPKDLGIKEKPKQKIEPAPIVSKAPVEVEKPPAEAKISQPLPAPVELGARPTPEAQAASKAQQRRYDTLLQFAAVELEGSIQKKQGNRF